MFRVVFGLNILYNLAMKTTKNIKKEFKNNIVIYQAKNGAVEFKGDFSHNTVWGSLQQIADLFDVQKPAISKHLKNIYKEGELQEDGTVSKMETVQKEGSRDVKRNIDYYNLDAILSVGYRVNSKQATQFRIWATKTLKQYLTKGYTINRKRILNNYDAFMQTVNSIQNLLPENTSLDTSLVLDLIKEFASTWISLDAYDKDLLTSVGGTKKSIKLSGEQLTNAIAKLKTELIKKGGATELFAQERGVGNIEGIVGNVMQSFGGKSVYITVEEKAANLLYFMVKNHPFTDGNKRSGAFAFVWFLQKEKVKGRTNINAGALTALTLLIAESNPSKKEQMISLITTLLSVKK